MNVGGGCPSVNLARSTQHERNGKRQWTFLAHVDATAHDLEPWQMREAIDMQNHPTPLAHAIVQLRRRTLNPWSEAVLGVAEMLALPAAVAGGAAVSALFSSAPFGAHLCLTSAPFGAHLCLTSAPFGALLAIGMLGYGAILAGHGARRLRNARLLPAIHQEPPWTGTRTYDFSAATSKSDAPHLATPPSNVSASTDVPTPTAFAKWIVEQRATHLSDRVALIVSGHGNIRRIAGFSPRALGQALAEAHRESGRPLDLVVLEGCLSASLETLRQMRGHARYALVSQEKMSGANLPWPYLLDHLSEATRSALPHTEGTAAAALGQSIVRWTGGSTEVPIPTLSLIDLDRIEALDKTLESLSRALHSWAGAGHRKEIRACLDDARHFPRQQNPLKRYLLYPDTLDLGQFLRAVQNRCTDAEIRDLARETAARLDETVVANQVAPDYQGQACGISVRDESPTFFERAYERQGGLPQWGRLIQHLRPWQTRVATSAFEDLWESAISFARRAPRP